MPPSVDEVRAFTDYLRSNPGGIAQARGHSFAEAALKLLFEEGMSAAELLERTRHPRFGEDLLKQIESLFKEADRYRELAKALQRFVVRPGGHPYSLPYEAAARHLRTRYIISRVRHFTDNGDWARAWYELYRGKEDWPRNLLADNILYLLVGQLYQRMDEKGVLKSYDPPQTRVMVRQNFYFLGRTCEPPQDIERDIVAVMLEYFHGKRAKARRRRQIAKQGKQQGGRTVMTDDLGTSLQS